MHNADCLLPQVTKHINHLFRPPLPSSRAFPHQVVQRRSAFTDVDNLVAICTALLDVQHYSPQLLQTAVATTFAQLPTVSSPTLVSLLLTLAFFRAGSSSSEFVRAALQELASREGLQQQLDRKHTAQLWRACVLLLAHAGIAPPAGVLQVGNCHPAGSVVVGVPTGL
jgi:hypothetical protein